MRKLTCYLLFFAACCGMACQSSRQAYNPDKKYSPDQLKEDFSLFRNILEDSHPSLYWYTTKDSLDHFFDQGYAGLKDSMTEPQFRSLLCYTISKIHCGHTSVNYSKAYGRYIDTALLRVFPLGIKCWEDTMVITANLNRRDSLLKRGTQLIAINGRPAAELRDTFFNYLVTDGYNQTGKYQTLSSGFNFGSWYKNIFGLPDSLDIRYLDPAGWEKQVRIPVYNPRTDTTTFGRHLFTNSSKNPGEKRPPRLNISPMRNLQIDTAGNTAFMTLNTFASGFHLKHFFRKSFQAIAENHIQNLVIDVRSNGGGETSNSTALTRYLIDHRFKLADSLYAISRHSHYDQYIGKSLLYRMMMVFVTRKRQDGKYHFGYFERHYYSPKTENHFDGHTYILIGGNSFSATTIFAAAVKGQKNITLVGEETGGGNYGNTAWMIPEVTLPNSHLRFRLPKFRLVVHKDWVKDGRGVMPDVPSLPTATAIRDRIDFKAEKVRELILSQGSKNR